MCGIFGYVGRETDAAQRVLEGLRKLEYRGYDSAGFAAFTDHHVEVRRCVGKLDNLETLLRERPLKGTPGYEPLAQGMRAALPFVDRFLPGHNLDSLEGLAGVLAGIERRHAA